MGFFGIHQKIKEEKGVSYIDVNVDR